MDLPTCPSCKQSVLDDDAEYCPFCGASMSGKPGKGPVATPPAKSGGPASKPGKTPAASKPDAEEKPKKSATKSSAPAADDDPFATKADTGEATPVSRKKTATRTHPVKCPMCDSAGYVPTKAANQDVKCWNTKCMVPVFTAPPLPEAPPPPPPPPPPKTNAIVLGVVLGLLVSGGVAAYIILDPFAAPPKPVVGPIVAPPKPGPEEIDPDKPEVVPEVVDPETPKVTAADLKKQILEGMIQASLSKENNRSKPYCRRLTAVAFALSGDTAGALKQIEALKNVGSDVPFFQINPETAVAWNLIEAGNVAEAEKAVDRAAALADSIPQFGRDPLETILELATVEVAIGRVDAARALFQDRDFHKPAGQLAVLFTINRETDEFDFADRPPAALVAGWASPAEVAVAVGLCAHSQWDAAKNWAETASNSAARFECLTAWGEMLTRNRLRNGESGPDSAVLEAAKTLPAGQRARYLAIIALPLLHHGDQPAAEALLKDAETALESVSVPKIPEFSGFDGLAEFKLTDAESLKHVALGAAEIAHLRAKMGQPTADKFLLASLAYCRGIAPSPALVAAREREFTSLGTSIARTQLRELFDLKSDDEARRKFNELRRKLGTITEAANERFQLETRILAAAIDWNLMDVVRDEILRSAQQNDVALQEPWLSTPLPERLLERYRETGNVDGGDEIANLLKGKPPVPDQAYQLRRQALKSLKEGKAQEVFKIIGQFGAEAQTAPLDLAARLAARSDSTSPLAELKALTDPLLREDVFRLVAAKASRDQDGDPAKIWKSTEELALSQTERVAVGLGIIEGMTARNQQTRSQSP